MENQAEPNVEAIQPIEQEAIQAPKELQRSMNFDHLSIILSNLAIVGIVVCIAGILGQIVFMVFAMLSFIVVFLCSLALIVLSFGIVLLSEDFKNFFHHIMTFSDDMEAFMNFFNAFYGILPYISAGLAGISLGAILCLKFNKNFKHTGRFVTSCIALGLSVVILLLFIIGGVL